MSYQPSAAHVRFWGQDSAFTAFWRELNAALELRQFAAATYGEARDFWASGYHDAAQVAGSWIPDD